MANVPQLQHSLRVIGYGDLIIRNSKISGVS